MSNGKSMLPPLSGTLSPPAGVGAVGSFSTSPSAPPPDSKGSKQDDDLLLARPPAMIAIDHSSIPWLADDGNASVVSPPAQPLPQIGEKDPMPPGIIRIKNGEDLFAALEKLDLLYSTDAGTSCMGRIIDNGQCGVVERQGRIKFVKPGQWTLWDVYTSWSEPATHSVADAVIRTKGVTIVTLNQRQVVVAKDQDGKSMLLSSGRFILRAPAALVETEEMRVYGYRSNADDQKLIINLVELPKQKQVQRFNFFNVPQGEVAGITLPTGQVRILLPGVHIIEDCKFERFLPTVPIQSKLKKEVVTSDLVTVSLEVDITTQLVDCARFLKMSAAQTHGAVGCKDLYDAIEESAQSHFVDTFGKTQYYNFRTRQGEVESKFEENALEVLDREARKYGGRILKINILKQRADAVEQVYATHNKQQIELEQKKQSQQREYDIADSEQKHRQQMAEREEKGAKDKQTLQQEREMARKSHELRLNMQDARAAQEKFDFESKAIAERQKMQAIAESEAAKVRAQGLAEQEAQQVLIVARATAQAEELKGAAAAKAEDLKAQARVAALSSLAAVLKENPAMLDLERQRLAEELQIKKLAALVESGARVVPVELMKLMDVADERVLKRLENQAVIRVSDNKVNY